MKTINPNTPTNPPEGFRLVKLGLTQKGDLLWTPESRQWEEASEFELGRTVSVFKAVARTDGKVKDRRVSLKNYLLEHEGYKWRIDAKVDPARHVLKVYRIEGSMANPRLLTDALQLLADSYGLKFMIEEV